MATSPAVADGASIPSPGHKMPLGTLIIAIVAAVLLSSAAVAGGIYFLMKSGRIPMTKGMVAVAVPAAAPAV